jgi:hypothetical protein
VDLVDLVDFVNFVNFVVPEDIVDRWGLWMGFQETAPRDIFI